MMIFLKILLLPLLCFSYETQVTVQNAHGFKTFKAVVIAEFDASLKDVISGIENFDDKCNNERRSRRKFFSWEKNCSFYNENLVEAVKIYDFKSEKIRQQFPNLMYLMWRNIYNRGGFSHYDVITKAENKNEVVITHQKISEELVSSAIKDPEKTISAFSDIVGTYKITFVSAKKTRVEYTYLSKTDHWFLMRDFLEENILNNMAKGTGQAVKSIEQSLKRKTRTL